MKGQPEDLTGRQYGQMHVLGRVPDKVLPSGKKYVMYACCCHDCGREVELRAEALRNGFRQRCECSKPKKQPGMPKRKLKPKAETPVTEVVETRANDLRPGGIQNFIAAFVRSCAKDIVNAPPDNTERKHTEKLLQSAYFERITGLDGELLLAKFREEAEKRQQKKRRKNACR